MRRHNSRHQPVINFGLVWWGPNREVRANGKESSVVFYCSSVPQISIKYYFANFRGGGAYPPNP